MRATTLLPFIPALAGLVWTPGVLGGCAAPLDGTSGAPFPDEGVGCEGKCDGSEAVQIFKSLIRDPSEAIETDTLVRAGATFADEGLNAALSSLVDGSIDTELYGLPDEQGTPPGAVVNDLRELDVALLDRFGRSSLAVEVQEARTEELESAPGVYAESSFVLSPDVSTSWNLSDTLGLDGLEPFVGNEGGRGSASVGFRAGVRLESTVVALHREGGRLPREANALLRTPLEAALAAKGFIFPRGVDDVRAMEPGEALSLHGEGALGMNFGMSVPVVAAHVAGPVTYHLAFRAALQTRLEGDLDVRLVRLGGDEAILDVGLSRAGNRFFRLALEDRFGVSGLGDEIADLGIDPRLDLGVTEVDLGEIADKALREQLNDKLDFFNAQLSRRTTASRLTVARFRLRVPDGQDEVFAQALAQALKGDVRLAQALAVQGHPSVSLEYDLAHRGYSSDFSAGLDLFSLRFFHRRQERNTSAIIQGPDGAQVLLFDTLDVDSGLFTAEWGHERQAVSSLRIRHEGGEPEVESEANLVVRLVESDESFQRDKLLDHVDALISNLSAPEALEPLDVYGSVFLRLGEEECRDEPRGYRGDTRDWWIECAGSLVDRLEGAREAALDEMAGILDELQVPEEERAIVERLARLRLANLSVWDDREPLVGALIAGLPMNLRTEVRLDDGALEQLLTRTTAADQREAFLAFLRVAMIGRGAPWGPFREAHRQTDDPVEMVRSIRAELDAHFAEERRDAESYSNAESVVEDLIEVFAEHQGRYQAIRRSQQTTVAELGSEALFLELPVVERRVVLEELGLSSYGQARAEVARDLYDALIDVAGDMIDGVNPHPETYVLYSLLHLTPRERRHLGAKIDIEVDPDVGFFGRLNWRIYRDRWARAAEAGHSSTGNLSFRGAEVQPIEADLFDLDRLSR